MEKSLFSIIDNTGLSTMTSMSIIVKSIWGVSFDRSCGCMAKINSLTSLHSHLIHSGIYIYLWCIPSIRPNSSVSYVSKPKSCLRLIEGKNNIFSIGHLIRNVWHVNQCWKCVWQVDTLWRKVLVLRRLRQDQYAQIA